MTRQDMTRHDSEPNLHERRVVGERDILYNKGWHVSILLVYLTHTATHNVIRVHLFDETSETLCVSGNSFK